MSGRDASIGTSPWDASLAAVPLAPRPGALIWAGPHMYLADQALQGLSPFTPLAPVQPALLPSTSCCLHQLVVGKGQRGGSSKANRADGLGALFLLLRVILDEPQ